MDDSSEEKRQRNKKKHNKKMLDLKTIKIICLITKSYKNHN